MKKNILNVTVAAGIVLLLLLISSIIVKADMQPHTYCDDGPGQNWGWCYYFPETGNYLCLSGPAYTCDGTHVE